MAQDLKFERVESVFAYKIFEANKDKYEHPRVYLISHTRTTKIVTQLWAGFFRQSACSHSFPRGHMTPNNRTVSRQNSPSGQHRAVESMTLEVDGVLLPANVDRNSKW